MNAQRLRNLTTGRLHTEMDHIYQDVEWITGMDGVMTHQLPNAREAMLPWLREMVTDPRFWDEAYDTTHDGDYPLEPMNTEARTAFWANYGQLPSLLDQIGANHR